ncbi:hypothetical protein [Serratia sp. FDAARGOS_506]|nr:hypothetical protein [Serratia sp. FDAARGOS_506]
MAYRQKNGAVLAFILMQGKSLGTFDAALNPVEGHPAVGLEKKNRS